ncbi:hypothetical protein QIA31_04840 (plasmid) [Borreliella turdi]
MASGMPLSHLKSKNIKTPYNSKSNILSYILDSGLLIKTYSLVGSNEISKCIHNLDKKKLLSIRTHKINYITKKIFDFEITTKQLKIAYSLIVKSKETLKVNKYTKNPENISLTKKPCILNLNEKLDYIKSFTILKPHKGNLNYYMNSMRKNTYTIAKLISNFFLKMSLALMYNFRLYINANFRKLGIYKNTSKLQDRIISKIFFLN